MGGPPSVMGRRPSRAFGAQVREGFAVRAARLTPRLLPRGAPGPGPATGLGTKVGRPPNAGTGAPERHTAVVDMATVTAVPPVKPKRRRTATAVMEGAAATSVREHQVAPPIVTPLATAAPAAPTPV